MYKEHVLLRRKGGLGLLRRAGSPEKEGLGLLKS